MRQDNGASGGPGSREPSPAVSALTGFDPSRYFVGQRLWFSPSRKFGSARWVVVTKVGRKWVTLGADGAGYFDGRVAVGSRLLDAGGHVSPGTLYGSPEEHAREREDNAAWDRFRQLVSASYRRPPHLNAVAIRRLASAMSAGTAETGTGSGRQPASAVGESRDATPSDPSSEDSQS